MEEDSLHWHALNYRTAGVGQAHSPWLELQAFVERKIQEARASSHTDQYWLHRIDMEKSAAWQQGYAQSLQRAYKPIGTIYRYGKNSSGSPWHGLNVDWTGLDLPEGTRVYVERSPLNQVTPRSNGDAPQG